MDVMEGLTVIGYIALDTGSVRVYKRAQDAKSVRTRYFKARERARIARSKEILEENLQALCKMYPGTK